MCTRGRFASLGKRGAAPFFFARMMWRLCRRFDAAAMGKSLLMTPRVWVLWFVASPLAAAVIAHVSLTGSL